MRARRVRRALRLAAPALAAVSVAAAGGSVAVPAHAGAPCDEGVLPTGGDVPLPCAETTPPPTVTETSPVEEPPPETETTPPAEPPPTVTTTTPSAPEPARARVRTKRSPLPTTSAPSSPGRRTTSPSTTGASSGATGSGVPPDNGTPTLSGGPYVFPVIGPSSFTDTWGAARATVAWHHGVDIFARPGAPIVAVADGTLFSVGWNTIGGRRLWLRDRQGNYFYYAHLSGFSRVAVNGARVPAGTVIGFVGNTGDAVGTPAHLHFEIHPVSLLSMGYDGAVDPFAYVSSWRRLQDALDAASFRAGRAVTWAAAATPGAILLGFADISSANGLAPESLDDTLAEGALATNLAYALEQPEATTSERGALPRGDAARLVRSLDSEASRGGYHEASVWDLLAVCESGGDWGANTGNGYIGGLQFLPQTWESHGGSVFAPSPHLATREQQIAVAERVLVTQGWRAWPACSAMLGLSTLASD